LGRQRRRLELLQILDRLEGDAVRVAILGGKIEQQDRDAGVGEVRRNLRAHHAGAEHGDLAHEEMRFGHDDLLGDCLGAAALAAPTLSHCRKPRPAAAATAARWPDEKTSTWRSRPPATG